MGNEQQTVRASYHAQLLRQGKIIAVVDECATGATVTNDAEQVVQKLGETFGGLEGRRIIYRDSQGMWDELRHDGFSFVGFAPIGARVMWEAVEKLEAAS